MICHSLERLHFVYVSISWWTSLWVVFTFWALWVALLWTYMCKDFFEHLFSILLGTYLCCCCSVAKSCPTLCDSVNCSTSDFPVLHYLPEVAQTHVHWVSDSIQPSHPLSPPSPTAFSLSHHQGLFQWVDSASGGQSITASGSASVLPINIQGGFPLGMTDLISLVSKGLSRVFSSITIWKLHFFGSQPSLWFNSPIRTWLLEKP